MSEAVKDSHDLAGSGRVTLARLDGSHHDG